MEKIRVGIVGLRRGRTYLRLFDKSFEETTVTAVCDNQQRFIDQTKEAGEISENMKVFNDYDEMIESGLVDAVMLADFFNEHADKAIKAMNKGIAVLSETTAAPSLGKCVELVETQEATGAKYMLAANCLYFPAVSAMKQIIESGKMGKIISGNAEYWHGGEPNPESEERVGKWHVDVHWRRTLPSSFYNMHTLGPLMYATNTVPVKVSCKPTVTLEHSQARGSYVETAAAMVITEMSDGSVFNTTGCNGIYHYPGKWYRLACANGVLESSRQDGSIKSLVSATGHGDDLTVKRYDWVSSGIIDEENYTKGTAEEAGHGGIDYFVAYHFIQYMLGKEEPFLNVYRSTALSAAGIVGWYSALSNGIEYPIPDFTKKEDRDKVRNDYRTPFADKYENITLPCKLSEKDKFEGYNF